MYVTFGRSELATDCLAFPKVRKPNGHEDYIPEAYIEIAVGSDNSGEHASSQNNEAVL